MDARTTDQEHIDRRLIRRCFEIARSAAAHGNHPFGSLIARGEEVLLEIENAVVTENDVTLHAETRLVSHAARRFPPDVLAEATLYTSTEPCLMCCGAIHWAGIRRLVYSAGAPAMAAVLGEPYHGIPAQEALTRMAPGAVVIGRSSRTKACKSIASAGRIRRAERVDL